MNTRLFFFWLVPLLVAVDSPACWAVLPLVTDDTGTQGKGNYSAELFLGRGWLRQDDIRWTRTDGGTTLYAGIREDIDILFTVPYGTVKARSDGAVTRGTGIGDLLVESLWRFYETGPWSFAVKPGITVPAGNAEKALGTGKVDYRAFFIAMREMLPFLTVFSNVGYIRNENTFGARKDIFHVSVAGILDITRNFRVAADTGAETSSDPTVTVPPAYFLGAVIYTVSERVDIDAGILRGLTKTEERWRLLVGTTIRF